MATLRAFILNQSILPTGNTVRDHIKNPSTGGPGGSLVLLDGLEIEMDLPTLNIELNAGFNVSLKTNSIVAIEFKKAYVVTIEL